MNVNLQKLASLAGVSLGTVSKAFSGSAEISQKTKDKIFALAKEYGCFDKYYKAKKARRVIAVICPELKSPYYTAMVTRIENILNSHGVIMFLSVSDFSAKKEAEIINYLSTSKSADGIIVIAGKSNIKFNKDMPIVALHTDRNNSEVDCINISFIDAINEAIKYLKDLGHKKIGFIGESLTKSKQEDFEKALQSNGLSVNPNWIFNQKERFEQAGKTAMEQMLLLEDKPSAIMCAYDNIALGAIEIIKKHGKSVPHDFSLIGFDDIPIASHVNVGLTTIKSNNDAICDLAIDLILKKIDSKFYALHQHITLHAELIVRSSVSKLN